MSGIATAIIGSAVVGGAVSAYGANKASDAAKEGAQIQGDAQMAELEYLKEREAIPQQFREGALRRIGGLYGLPGGEADQGQLIESLRGTPIYQAIVGNRKFGEEAILRNASATGGLRSGNVQGALYDYNTQLENDALLQAYSGLTGLANLPSNTNQIANVMGDIGATRAQGVIASGQAWQQGLQGVSDSLFGGLNTYLDYKKGATI